MMPQVDSVAHSQPANKRWQVDKKGFKNIAFLAGVVLASSAAVYGCQNNKDDQTKGKITPPPVPTISPQQSDAALPKNLELQKQAVDMSNAEVDFKASEGKSGIAGIPPLPLPPVPKHFKNDAYTKDTVGTFQAPPAPPSNNALSGQQQEGLAKQLQGLTKVWGYSNDESQQKNDYVRAKPSSNNASKQAEPTTATAANAPPANGKGKRLAGAMEVVSARLLQTINSDHPNATVRAEIQTGKLKGAIALGKAERLEQGLQISYSGVAVQGCLIKAAAIALDENTSLDVVAGKYDGRYAARFVFPVLLQGVKAYTTARAQTGNTVVVVNGTTGTQTPAPSSEQARNAMVAASVSALETGIKQGLPTTPQVTLNMGETIGVMFLEPVYEDTTCSANQQGAQ